MKNQILILGLLLFFLCGCATRYEITTTGSARYTSVGKPQRVGGWYVFKEVSGKTNFVSAMRVRTIEPVSRWHKSKDPFGAPGK
ncbi:MAG: hypothetical protein HY043_18165 [Verrucomicrobia bacterium]|nr:hypothetical protein [Verrucomicrobiota bacterium]